MGATYVRSMPCSIQLATGIASASQAGVMQTVQFTSTNATLSAQHVTDLLLTIALNASNTRPLMPTTTANVTNSSLGMIARFILGNATRYVPEDVTVQGLTTVKGALSMPMCG